MLLNFTWQCWGCQNLFRFLLQPFCVCICIAFPRFQIFPLNVESRQSTINISQSNLGSSLKCTLKPKSAVKFVAPVTNAKRISNIIIYYQHSKDRKFGYPQSSFSHGFNSPALPTCMNYQPA